MTHLTEEQLYNIVHKTEETQPYNNSEMEQMIHLKTCKECYDKFCAALVLEEVTSESGYIFLSAARSSNKKTINTADKLLAVIDVVRNKVENTIESVLEQVEQIGTAFNFVISPAFATRGIEEGNSILKLVDIEDEKTFIAFDSEKGELLVQINTKNLGQRELKVYIKFEDEDILELTMVKKGNIVKSIAKNIPNKNFKIYVEYIS